MNITKPLIAFALLAGVTPALAAENPPAPAKDSKDERVVCRTQAETGSRLAKKKICMTVAEWRDLSFRQGQALDKRTAELPKPGG